MTEEQKKDDSAAVPPAQEAEKLREELKKCLAEREEYLNGWKRARADYANLEKEEAKRFEEFAKFATRGLLLELIDFLDSFDLVMKELTKKGAVDTGLELLYKQCEDLLRRRGLTAIETKTGEKCNPAIHESIAEVESKQSAGTIVEQVKKGYALHGKVIRPAKVVISK